jgi:ribonucleotide monophosphatase NagD (HAD superfamily)
MVGDDGEADVIAAAAAGLPAALVQTGKYRPGDRDRLPADVALLVGIGALGELLHL